MTRINSTIAKKMWIGLTIFTILLMTLILTLQNGISLKQFVLPGFNAKELYIKLDKKLIVQIKSIKIKFKKSKANSKDELYLAVKRLPLVNKFFSIIDIEEMDFDDNIVTLLYKNNTFYLNTKYLTLDTKLSLEEENLKANIKSLMLKDFNFKLNGIFRGYIKNLEGKFIGKFESHNIKGNIKLNIDKKNLLYELDSENFSSLEPFMEALNKKIKINKTINEWIYKKIIAKEYKLNFLSGKYSFKDKNFHLHDLKGSANAKQVKVQFHENAPFAKIENLDIILKNDTLYFLPNEASFQGKKIKKADIFIQNLFSSKGKITIKLNTNSPLNEDIKTILKAYNVDIPILQKSGENENFLKITIAFKPFNFSINGDFKAKNADILIANAAFKSAYSHIILNDFNLSIKEANLRLKDIFDINVNGIFDIRKKEFEGNTKIDFLSLKNDKNIFLDIHKSEFTSFMKSQDESFLINIPSLKSKFIFKKDISEFYQESLKTIMPYSPVLSKNKIFDGSIFMKTKNFSNYKLDLNLSDFNSSFMKYGKVLNSMNFDANISKDEYNIASKDACVFINGKNNKNDVFINSCDIVFQNSDDNNTFKYNLYATNSKIFLKEVNKTLPFDTYEANHNGKDFIFKGIYEKSKLDFNKSEKFLNLDIKGKDMKFVNKLLGSEVFKGGDYNVLVKGYNIKHFIGHLNFNNTYIKNFQNYNNFLALINAIPSLITLKLPSFNNEGYFCKRSDILFERDKDLITIHSIDIKGIDVDIVGDGKIDLKNDFVDIKLELKTLKNISNIIGKIPLINNVLLGDENTIQTSISVKGKMKDLKVETHTAKEAVLMPFNIIKRTIKLPFKIFED